MTFLWLAHHPGFPAAPVGMSGQGCPGDLTGMLDGMCRCPSMGAGLDAPVPRQQYPGRDAPVSQQCARAGMPDSPAVLQGQGCPGIPSLVSAGVGGCCRRLVLTEQGRLRTGPSSRCSHWGRAAAELRAGGRGEQPAPGSAPGPAGSPPARRRSARGREQPSGIRRRMRMKSSSPAPRCPPAPHSVRPRPGRGSVGRRVRGPHPGDSPGIPGCLPGCGRRSVGESPLLGPGEAATQRGGCGR